jgi:hypothetical protein
MTFTDGGRWKMFCPLFDMNYLSLLTTSYGLAMTVKCGFGVLWNTTNCGNS